jgi:hypothetical protein
VMVRSIEITPWGVVIFCVGTTIFVVGMTI